MRQGGLRGTLLATSSALALIVGVEGSADAAAPCTVNNVNGPINNTTTINCISFNNGGTFSGPVTNAPSGVLNASGGTPNQPFPGSATGISVVGGSHLTGSITNQGSITTSFRGINVGGGQYGAPGGSVGGSITNNGSITSGRGIELNASSSVTGDLINNGTINYIDTGFLLQATALTAGTLTGSIINAGTVSGIGGGIAVQHYTVTGSITNTVSGTITSTAGFAGMEVSFGSLMGSLTNAGTITIHGTNHDALGMFVEGASVGGSIGNSGTINGDFGIGVSGTPATPAVVKGDVVNSGTINANSGTVNAHRPGIIIAGATIGGNITNTATGHINAPGGIGIFLTSSTTPGGTSVGGAIVNQGSISARTGIAVGGLSTVAGGITNTGNITASGGPAIDLVTLFGGSGAAMVINQQAGTITGDILLSSLGDTVNVTGGAIAGNIIGTGSSGTVNFALGAGNSFTYSNAITGVQAVNVNSGTLFDNNSITATTVNVNGGTLAPGQPGAVGTLTITGSLAFSNLATYLVTLSPPAASRTNVTGPASVAGTVKVAALPGPYVFGTTYTILTATTGVTGTFGGVTSSSSVTGKLSYDAHDVFLTVAPNLLTPLLPPGSPTNVLNVASAIDNFNISNGGVFPSGFQTLFGLTPQQLSNALTQLSGELGTGAPLSAFELMTAFMSLLTGPFAGGHGVGTASGFAPDRAQAFPPEIADAYASVLKAPPAPAPYGRYNVWGAAYGGTNNTSGDPTVGSHDVTARAGGFTGGVDYRISPDTVVGFALAGGATTWGLSAGLGSGRSDAFQAGLYGRQEFGAAYFSGALAFANYWASTTRTVTVAGFDTLSASFNAQSFGGRAEAGYRVAYAPFTLTPYAALQAQSFSLPSYSETAASGSSQFALAYNANTATAVRAELGSWISKTMVLADASALAMFGRAAWAHDWDNSLALTPTFLGLPTASFVVNGAKPPANLALLTAGAELRMRNGWSVMGRFDGEFAQGSQTYTGTARVRYTW